MMNNGKEIVLANDLEWSTMALGKCEDFSLKDTWNKSSVGVEPSHGAECWSHPLANGEQMLRQKIRGRDQGLKIFTCKLLWQTSPSIKEKTAWEKTSGATVGRVLPNAWNLNLQNRYKDSFCVDQRKTKRVGTDIQIIRFCDFSKPGKSVKHTFCPSSDVSELEFSSSVKLESDYGRLENVTRVSVDIWVSSKWEKLQFFCCVA